MVYSAAKALLDNVKLCEAVLPLVLKEPCTDVLRLFLYCVNMIIPTTINANSTNDISDDDDACVVMMEDLLEWNDGCSIYRIVLRSEPIFYPLFSVDFSGPTAVL